MLAKFDDFLITFQKHSHLDRIFLLLIMVTWILFIGIGCNPRTEREGAIDAQISETAPHIPTSMKTIVPTKTVTPLLLSATPTQRKKTPSFTPTISPIALEAILAELISKNKGCRLPCWWGIEPGISSWGETEAFFRSIGEKPEARPKPDGTILHSVIMTNLFDNNLSMQIKVKESNGISEVIDVGSDGFYDPQSFRTLWAAYSLDRVLKLYGPPSRVWVQTYNDQVQPPGDPSRDYGLWVFYDQEGFILLYQGKYGHQFSLCPTFSDTGNLGPYIYIILTSREPNIPLEELVGEQGGILSSLFPIQQAAQITEEEFYKILTKDEAPICFKTNPKIWP
jgi:hypothetical protein